MPEPLDVVHDPAGRRFCVALQGYEACLMYRLVPRDRSGSLGEGSRGDSRGTGQTIDLYHTYVPEVFRGRGIAEALCKAAFEHAKATHLTVVPSCSYISGAYLKRHPEYEPLVKRGGPASNPLVSG